MTRLLLVSCFLFLNCLHAQDFQLKKYRVENGLPGDVVKAVAQDSLGFIWVATDDGLVKFDGLRFTTYKNALHSQYAKGFLKTSSGRLLLFGDLDLIEIDNRIDTVLFKSIKRGNRNPADTTLWYPKALYEDKDHDLWVAEPQSVVRLRGTQMKRFHFDVTEMSQQFLRSFTFFEDLDGGFYVISFFGRVYRYNPAQESFRRLSVKFPSDIFALKRIGEQVWIAAPDGVHSSVLSAGLEPGNPKRIFSIPNASDFKLLDDDHLMIATTDQTHHIANLKTQRTDPIDFNINAVNSIFVSQEEDIWLASTDGLILLQKNLFRKVGEYSGFVDAIVQDKTKKRIYFSIQNLHAADLIDGEPANPETIYTTPRGNFQALQVSDNGLWATNGFSLFLFRQEKVARQWDLLQEGKFIQDIFLDSEGNVWLSRSGGNSIPCLTSEFKIKWFPVSLGIGGNVNVAREGDNGVYLGASGAENYLYFKGKKDSVFKNVSIPVDFPIHGDFNIIDMATVGGRMWLASTEGLIVFDRKSVRRVDLGEKFTLLSVKSVEAFQDNQVLFANSFGLFLYDMTTGDYWLYDESNGLTSNTITTRGIWVSPEKQVWVGTSRGLSYSRQSIIKKQRTLTPYFIDVKIDGQQQKFVSGVRMPYGSFVHVLCSSTTFPEGNVTLQYRLLGEDSVWRPVEKNELAYSNLTAGRHQLQIKARKNGGYEWSRIRTLDLVVAAPYWKQAWFIITIIFTIAIIAWLSFSLAIQINQKRRKSLQQLVDQRTQQLQKSNEELTVRNLELDRFVYSASHDLSAPLKSVLGLINVMRMERPEEKSNPYLKMMEKSVNKMETFIKDVVNYSRNTRLAVEYKEIDFSVFVQNLINDHEHTPNGSEIDFRVQSNITTQFICDEMRLKIILNNLLSNAIKFHNITKDQKPFVCISLSENESQFIISVADNGRGIEANLKGKIFNMFFRGTDSVPGSGLGLYILKETVTRLGGTFSVQSKLGEGSTFTIRIPKVMQSAPIVVS